ncbi:MAG: P-II family nitrogen regulator [Candidatus Competibacteraceae bacterium]|jgi:nitrogen regulatory protein PII|nr:P-II family nitrogen regulator [Candidatus Competibacteraceae bacterium]
MTAQNISFHPMKRIEIIVKGEKESFVRDLLDQAEVSGYTLIRDIAGMGHHGFHEGRLLFNETASLVLFMAVGPQSIIQSIAEGLRPIFEKNSGVMFFSTVEVVRMDYFDR